MTLKYVNVATVSGENVKACCRGVQIFEGYLLMVERFSLSVNVQYKSVFQRHCLVV